MKNLQIYLAVYKKEIIEKLINKNKKKFSTNKNNIGNDSPDEIDENIFRNCNTNSNLDLIEKDKKDLKDLFYFCKSAGGKFDNFIVNYLDFNNRFITSKENIKVKY